eukprot:10240605-Karenia_brevis.AAC.1
MGKPPPAFTPRGSFAAIQGLEDYTGERCDLAPMDIASLSLPKAGFQPQNLDSVMGDAAPSFVHEA